ncbi:MAG: DUF3419 family protein [Romboutsia sp.]|nr:DUF3419 family protein [Romboutsia sp.]
MFDFIRYSNSWEDTDIICEALQPTSEDTVISICAAGDNPLALASYSPKKVIAIDINKTQIYLFNLKREAFRQLEYNQVLEFLGVNDSKNRLELYNKIKENLDKETKSYWDNNIGYINEGVIHIGKFENYFTIFRTKVLKLIHTKKTINEFINKNTIEEQNDFYHKKWNNARWKMIFKIFFGKKVMGKLGRDKSFFKYVNVNVGVNILKRVEFGIFNNLNKTNPYLNYILKGDYTEESMPYYLRKENFEKIKKNLDKIEVFNGDVVECIRLYNGQVNKMYLSDIFEYMDPKTFEYNISEIEQYSDSKTTLIYFNMLADRVIDNTSEFIWDKKLSNNLTLKDKAFFYKRLIIAKKG